MKRKQSPHSTTRGGPSAANRLSKAVLATGITFLLGDVPATAQMPIYQNVNTTSRQGITYSNTAALSSGGANITGVGAWDSLMTVNTAKTTDPQHPYWKITSTSVGVYNSGSTSRTETVHLTLYGGVNTSTQSGQIVTNALGTYSKSITLAPGSNMVQIATPNAGYTPSALGATGTPIGVQMIVTTTVSGNALYDGGAGPLFCKAAPTQGSLYTNTFYGLPGVWHTAALGSAGTTPNAFTNKNGYYYLGSSEGFGFYAGSGPYGGSGALYTDLQLNGIAVPGPSSVVVFAGLGTPILGLLRRRRQRFARTRSVEGVAGEPPTRETGHVPRRAFVGRSNQRRC